MEFYSNGHGSGSGFALRLSQIENSCPKKGSSCGGDFSKEQFRVEGPSTPGGACLYVVRKFDPAVCKLQVRFQRFSLGADGACSRPRLLIAGRSLCGSRKADDVGRSAALLCTDDFSPPFPLSGMGLKGNGEGHADGAVQYEKLTQASRLRSFSFF
ncbi:hypothetical protein HPB48_001581 [Haemaphysalis longicornis]|uniref:CUB domain-containing protein n=1 Tax=Haemaphysalis longicornis TaxID=44386 RepID=A0A9J6FER2_HAELO|nr:hypothetical protein HPB48_001581 [Haemaphysalis longicornis]